MKRASRRHVVREAIYEYDARRGIRGKYGRSPRMAEVHSAELLHVSAPLVGLRWSGSEFEMIRDISLTQGPGLAFRLCEKDIECQDALAREEWDRCRHTTHWLSYVHARNEALSVKAKMNALLLALWLARPTRTHVPFRFEASESGVVRTVARVLDRFQWLEPQVQESVRTTDLGATKRLLSPLMDVYGGGGRLRNALILTFRGCLANDWQSSFVCFAAGAEALLTCSRGRGLTDRLARNYGTLSERAGSDPAAAKETFKRLYKVRSDIVHGRAHDRRDPTRNLDDLAEFSDLLRQLWTLVLQSADVRAALEGDDVTRQAFFRGA